VFAAMVTMTTGLVVGLLPARRAAGTDLIDSLRAPRSSTLNRNGRTVRGLMVTVQIDAEE
jgi:hypothetical protein